MSLKGLLESLNTEQEALVKNNPHLCLKTTASLLEDRTKQLAKKPVTRLVVVYPTDEDRKKNDEAFNLAQTMSKKSNSGE